MKFMSLVNPTDFVKVELRLRNYGVMYRWPVEVGTGWYY